MRIHLGSYIAMSKIQATEMRSLRNVKGFFRLERIRNEDEGAGFYVYSLQSGGIQKMVERTY